MPLVDDDSAAISQLAGNSVAQPAHSAAIFMLSAHPTKIEDAPLALRDILAVQRRPPFAGEFAATSGDWVAFKRRFLTNAGLAGWTETEALWALPAALDHDAFLAILPPERSTVTQAFDRMASIYKPPANARHKFATRRKGEDESALAFHNALLALVKATFPEMDNGINTLVLERLLALAETPHIILPAEDDDISSLKIATCIRAQLLLQRDRAQVTCAMSCMGPGPGPPDGTEPLFACASTRGGGDRRGDGAWRTVEQRRPRSSSHSGGGRVTFYNCGLPGHVSSMEEGIIMQTLTFISTDGSGALLYARGPRLSLT
ncbi:unnamed protein product [Lampetra fluviatilis]